MTTLINISEEQTTTLIDTILKSAQGLYGEAIVSREEVSEWLVEFIKHNPDCLLSEVEEDDFYEWFGN